MNHIFYEQYKGILTELNLRRKKWLLFTTYHHPSQFDDYYFSHVNNCLDTFNSPYDWFLYLNAEDSEEALFNFLEKHYAANIVKDKTRFKSLDNPSCNDAQWSKTDPDASEIHFSILKANQIFITWLLLSWRYFLVKHLQKKYFTEVTKTLI